MKLNIRTIFIHLASFLVLFLVLMGGVRVTYGENTHSIDFESSSGQYVFITDADQMGLDITSDFTIETWVKIEQLPSVAGAPFTIVDKEPNTGGYRVIIDPADNSLRVYYWDSFGIDSISKSSSAIVASSDVGKWVHIAVSVGVSTQSFAMYKDGQSVNVTSVSTGASSVDGGASSLAIGATNVGSTPTWFFDGLIDEVRIWNDVRTPLEIEDDRLSELNGNEAGLVGYWKFNSSLTDSSGNGNILTNTTNVAYSVDTPFTDTVEDLTAVKIVNESLSSSTELQNDDDLTLVLLSSKTYEIDGVIFASTTSAAPDLKIAFTAPTGAVVRIGYTNDVNEAVLDSGAVSSSISLTANAPTSIHIKGTIKTSGTAGTVQLKWAQASSNTAEITVMRGSYLKAESL